MRHDYDAIVIGAGMAGMYMLYKLREMGLSARVFEAGGDVGGTWYWNRYPGARVDIESQEYSFSFSAELEQEWVWTERYASQPEILRYLNHVADRFDLRRDIQFKTRVERAHYDDENHLWRIETDAGDSVHARYCVSATGCLSVPNEPNFPGQERFAGHSYHTGRWPHEGVDLSGKRVAIIGTGSSSIQSITEIAGQVGQLYVFQRTPNFSVPAHNGPASPDVRKNWLANRAENRLAQRQTLGGFLSSERNEQKASEVGGNEHRQAFEARWAEGGFAILGAFGDLMADPNSNAAVANFAGEKIREIVRDPKVAERLTPKDYPFGAKRLCVDTGYYENFNRPNVELVDLNETPLHTITEKGVATTAAEYEVDAIIFAIGFDAMTGALSRIDVRGRGGRTLADAWAEGPKSYLGIMVSGFPNFFTITGPGSPSVLSNMVVSIEQHVEWLAQLFAFMDENMMVEIDPSQIAQDGWVDHVNEVANFTVYPYANSWYLGANIPGKPRVFMPYAGGVGVYRDLCAAIAANLYMGFKLKLGTAGG
jgi:cyclohexanone monooxygenase